MTLDEFSVDNDGVVSAADGMRVASFGFDLIDLTVVAHCFITLQGGDSGRVELGGNC